MVNVLPVPLISVEEAIARRKQLIDLIDRYLEPGIDYDYDKRGDDDNAKQGKKVLRKPGGEKLSDIFGFSSQDRLIQRNVEFGQPVPFIYFEVACDVIDQSGRVLATRSGVCSTAELKYRYTWINSYKVEEMGLRYDDLPVRKTIKGKNGKKDFTLYRIDNPAVGDLINTVRAMAAKRAFLSAIKAATATTGIFEEMDEDALEESQTENERAPLPAPKPAGQPEPKATLPGPTPQTPAAAPAQDKSQEEPESGKCAECGDEVPKAVKAYSNQHFGKTLCRNHQPKKDGGQ